jgi:hypothetical protein
MRFATPNFEPTDKDTLFVPGDKFYIQPASKTILPENLDNPTDVSQILPLDILVSICSHLSLRDIFKVAQVCKVFSRG